MIKVRAFELDFLFGLKNRGLYLAECGLGIAPGLFGRGQCIASGVQHLLGALHILHSPLLLRVLVCELRYELLLL